MTKKPFPKFNKDALSELASQYPGSGAPRLAASTSESETSRPAAPSGTTGAGAGAKAPAAPARAEPRRGGGFPWFSSVMALVAVVAAVGALAAPSLRIHVREALYQHAPMIPREHVEFWTGLHRPTMEVDLATIDERIQRLQSLVSTLAQSPSVDRGEVVALLRRSDEEARFAQLEAATSGVPAMAQALTDAERRLGAADAERAALRKGVEAAANTASGIDGRLSVVESRTRSLEESAAKLGGLEERIAAGAQEREKLASALGETTAKLAGMDARIAATGDELKTSLAAAQAAAAEAGKDNAALRATVEEVGRQVGERTGRLDAIEASLRQVGEVNRTVNWPMFAVTQLRASLQTPLPYVRELDLAERFLAGDPQAAPHLTALRTYSQQGVPTTSDLRQSFTFIAGRLGGRTVTRIESWAEKVTGWVDTMLGRSGMPEATPQGRISATLASIDSALEVGQLSLAIDEAANLAVQEPGNLLEAWLAQARSRLTVDRSFAALSNQVVERFSKVR